MHGIGCSILEMLVNADGGDYRCRTIPCGSNHQYEFIEFRYKKLLTVLGPVTVKRAYYYDREYRNGVLSERPRPGHRGDIIQFRGAPDDEQGGRLPAIWSRS